MSDGIVSLQLHSIIDGVIHETAEYCSTRLAIPYRAVGLCRSPAVSAF